MKVQLLNSLKVLAIIGICISVVGISPLPAEAQSVKLTYSNFFPPTHIQSQLPEAWCKEVEARTQGRVTIQYYPGQTLTQARQTYDSVVDGIADIGLSAMAYTPGRFPLMLAIDLPFGYTSGIAATAAANELFQKFNPKEFSGVQVMYFHAHGPGFIHTKDKPIRKMEDLKGQKIRSTGYSADVVRALGGTPVTMPMPETYQSLQKGVVDGSAHPVEANSGWKLGEVTQYVTYAYPAAYTTAFYVVMNKNKWNSISAADKKIIEEINQEWAKKHGEAWDESDMIGLRFFLQQGNTVIGISSRDSEAWAKAVEPLIEKYSKDLDQKGMNGKAVVDNIRTTLKRFE